MSLSTASTVFDDRVPLGVVFLLAFCATAPLIDVAAKMASQSVTVTQVTLMRFVVQAVLMAVVVAILRQSFAMAGDIFRLIALRAIFSIASTYAFVAAVSVMPLADALAIAFVEPFILLILGHLIYKETVGPRRIIACTVGFGGAMLVIQPNFQVFGSVALFPLVTAFSFAGYMLITRQISRRMSPVVMNFHTAWLATAIMAPMLLLGAVTESPLLALTMPAGVVWLQLCAVGVAASVAHLFMSYALKHAPSSTLAPLHYLEIVGAVGFGWFFFADWPNALSWAGITVICSSGLYIIYRERVNAHAAKTVPILTR
jgi:drug/metabolite transporter (DMT)-like permease